MLTCMAYSQHHKKTGLPRLVLKWLQSLDLSFSQKNVPLYREFSNGYLVAEIFSRYFPKYIEMRYYDRGMSVSAKQNNWNQIERFLQRHDIQLKNEVIDGTIHCKPGAAELLLQDVYTFLTNQRIKGMPEHKVDFTDGPYQRRLPCVARATASQSVKTNLRSSEVLAQPDIVTNQRKIVAIIDTHMERRAAERMEDPGRFKSRSTEGRRLACLPLPTAWRNEGSEQSKFCYSSIKCEAPVSFKEINIRQPLRDPRNIIKIF